jgi:hypothetical protein
VVVRKSNVNYGVSAVAYIAEQMCLEQSNFTGYAALHDPVRAAIGILLFRSPDAGRPVAAEGYPERLIGWVVGGPGSRVGGRRQEQSTIRTS